MTMTNNKKGKKAFLLACDRFYRVYFFTLYYGGLRGNEASILNGATWTSNAELCVYSARGINFALSLLIILCALRSCLSNRNSRSIRMYSLRAARNSKVVQSWMYARQSHDEESGRDRQENNAAPAASQFRDALA